MAERDIAHAYEHAVRWVELGEDPARYLLAGPRRSGDLPELVVLVLAERELVIHAMRLRPATAALLVEGEDR